MLDYHFWRLKPFGYHLTNIVLHAIAAILVYQLIKLLFFDFKLAFVTSLLFTIHPLQSEAVAYISGRPDSLAAIFILLSIYLFIKFRKIPEPKKEFFYLGSLLAFCLALLSKELALVLPFALILCDSLPDKQKLRLTLRKKILIYLPYVLLGAAYAFLRLKVLTFGSTKPVFSREYMPLFARILGFFKAFFVYLGLLAYPHNLHMNRAFELPQTYFQPLAFIGAFFLVLTVIFAIRSYRRYPLIYFGIFWFIIFLFPQANLLLPMLTPLAEHFLYLPSIGFFLLLGLGIQRLPQIKFKRTALSSTGLIWVLFVVYCVFLESVTLKANQNWRDTATLWKNTLRFSPQSVIARNNLGAVYLSQHRLKAAEEELLIAKKLSRRKYGEIYFNLGGVYFKEHKFDLAEKEFKQALEIAPNNLFIRTSLAKLYLITDGYLKQAEEQFNYVLKIDPQNLSATYGLAKVYDKQGFTARAITQYRRVIAIEPDHGLALLDLGFAYAKAGRFSEAEAALQQAVKFWPESSEVRYRLGKFYWEKGQTQKALAQWNKAIKLNPNHLKTRIHLKVAHSEKLNRP
jgi:tetratricopeptide (TPR) repeat protein